MSAEKFRRSCSIIRTTAVEILSEPLSLLILLAALALAVLAPAFHYHQFGEATRMARDAGFSALFTCGTLLSVFGTIRAFRREIESGTLEMALAHPVSRGGFFLAKAAGAALAYLVFAVIVFFVTLIIVNGAAIGGEIAARSNDIARLWGPSFALGVFTVVGSLVIAAALNRFLRCRFVLSVFAMTLLLSFAGAFYRFDSRLALRLIPVSLPLVFAALFFLSSASACAVRWRTNAAVSAVGLLAAATIPCAGNYYLTDALARDGSLAWSYVGLAAVVTLPAIVAFLFLGVSFLAGRDPS